MAAYKKYSILKCSVCLRSIQREEDKRRILPKRCIITNKCSGILEKVDSTDVKTSIYFAGESGISDYVQRGQEIESRVEVQEEAQVSVLAGTDLIALAPIFLRTQSGTTYFSVTDSNFATRDLEVAVDSFPSELKVSLKVFELTSELIEFNSYYYVLPQNTQVAQGNDSSDRKKTLRFTSADNLKVLVNGIELDSSKYDRSVDNLITFTPLLVESTNIVQIYVYRKPADVVDSSKLISLDFFGKSPLIQAELEALQQSAWGNFNKIKINSAEKIVLHGSIGELGVGKAYAIHSIVATGPLQSGEINLDPLSMFILLSSRPHSFADKNLIKVISLGSFKLESDLLSYQTLDTGELDLRVKESLTIDLLKPIVGSEINAIVSDNSAKIAEDEKLQNQFIIGVV